MNKDRGNLTGAVAGGDRKRQGTGWVSGLEMFCKNDHRPWSKKVTGVLMSPHTQGSRSRPYSYCKVEPHFPGLCTVATCDPKPLPSWSRGLELDFSTAPPEARSEVRGWNAILRNIFGE